MRVRLRYLGLVFLVCQWGFATNDQVFRKWRSADATWIKVGLQEETRVGQFHSKSRLLVLDGDRVVGELRPNGSFRVLVDPKASDHGRFWVQLQASRDLSVLKRTKTDVASKFSDVNLEFFRSGQSSMMALRAGPCATRSEANALQARSVSAGFADAYLVRMNTSSPFSWVNSDFDKFPLDAPQLGLVSADPQTPIGFGDRSYRGILWFKRRGNEFRVINELPLETYLRAVVPSELGPLVYPELESQKAQAVAARTYALKNMDRFASAGYDICDGPACQAYFGSGTEHPLSDQAVTETRGLVMTYEGELIDALYTSTCGGQTDDVENVFPGRAEPYLRSRTSYLLEPVHWTLPARQSVNVSPDLALQNLQARAVMFGFPVPPNLAGPLTETDLRDWLQNLAWLLNVEERQPETSGKLTHAKFWGVLAELPFFKQAVGTQVQVADLKRVLESHGPSGKLDALMNLLRRYDVLTAQQEQMVSSDAPISRATAMELLVSLCEAFGPKPEWSKYYVQEVVGNDLVLVRKGRERLFKLERLAIYVTEQNGAYRFLNEPQVSEGEIVHVLDGVLARSMVRITLNGEVASVDRVSAYNYWLDKKTVSELESRARRYIRGLRGIHDVRVLSRSETGRVTELEFQADSGTHRVKGLQIRWSLGVPDNLLELLPAYRKGRLVHLTVIGRGWGHGVGMSQVGSYGLATAGWTFDQILNHYYTGIEIGTWPR